MKKLLQSALFVPFVLASSASANELDGQTFVHLFEWPWSDVAHECESYLGPNGYHAIQVSPANEHINYPTWWARYQPVTFDKFESFSGSEEALRSMLQRCNAAGVKVYADAVINHTADFEGEGVGTSGTPWRLMEHPGLSPANYHDDCTIQSYQRATEVQECKLGALPDLDTSQPYIRGLLRAYLNRLADLGFNGVRIDAAKHISREDLAVILEDVQHDFVFLEVIGDPSSEALLQPASYTNLGAVTDFSYRGAIYNALSSGSEGVISVLQYSDADLLNGAVVFVDNHDTERHTEDLTTEQKRFLESLLLTSPYGYPKVLSGYRFDNRDQRPAQLNVSCGDVWTCWHRDPVVTFFANARAEWTGQTRSEVTSLSEAVTFLSIGDQLVFINSSTNEQSVNVSVELDHGNYCSLVPNDASTLDVGWFAGTTASLQPLTIAVFDTATPCD